MMGSVVYIDPEWNLFDELSLSESDVSILSDPFSEEGNECGPAPGPKAKIGQDVFSTLDFSQSLKDAVDKTGLPLTGKETMMAETADQIRVRTAFSQIRRKVPLMAQIRIVNLLNDRHVEFPTPSPGENTQESPFVPDEKKTWEDLKDEVMSNRNLIRNIRRFTQQERNKKLSAQAQLDEFDTMSGYWRILSQYPHFTISPPGHNAYAKPPPHPLQTEPIPWQVAEASTRKVSQWLNKHFRYK